MAAGPRSKAGVKACRALARHRMEGIEALGYLALFQVTRCKSGTNGGRCRRNGYVHPQKIQRLKHSHHWQVESSHRSSHRVWGHAQFTRQQARRLRQNAARSRLAPTGYGTADKKLRVFDPVELHRPHQQLIPFQLSQPRSLHVLRLLHMTVLQITQQCAHQRVMTDQ